MNKKYLLINTAVAGVFGIITGRLVGYYRGKYEGTAKALEETVENLAKAHVAVDAAQKAINEQVDELNKLIIENEELKVEIAKYKTKEILEEREGIKKEKAKEAIKNKNWDEVYRLTERWYNKYPVDMARYEVFRYLKNDGYVTDEEVSEARDYFGSLWNYVGD